MSVSLNKGGNASLSKEPPGLSAVMIGLGWAARATSGAEFDLDASALLLGSSGKVKSDADFIFFNNLISADGSVQHLGDELVGGSGGDDEQIRVTLAGVAADADKIVVTVSIYDAEARSRSFGQVRNAYSRVVNRADNAELTRNDLSEDASTETAMIFGELYRSSGEWRFRAVGQGYSSGLGGIARDFGVHVG